MKTTSLPFSNVQIGLLKLFSTNLSESELNELKSIQLANHVWNEKNLTSKDMDDWLNDKEQ